MSLRDERWVRSPIGVWSRAVALAKSLRRSGEIGLGT
jgi:hypothetical protein